MGGSESGGRTSCLSSMAQLILLLFPVPKPSIVSRRRRRTTRKAITKVDHNVQRRAGAKELAIDHRRRERENGESRRRGGRSATIPQFAHRLCLPRFPPRQVDALLHSNLVDYSPCFGRRTCERWESAGVGRANRNDGAHGRARIVELVHLQLRVSIVPSSTFTANSHSVPW